MSFIMYKRNRISDQEYRELYTLIMRNLNYANKSMRTYCILIVFVMHCDIST